MPSLPHRPALAPRDGISSFASVQSSDSYYSNEEIAILHDVVSAAQENLNLLPEGERLATNALFQAYDAVLPVYGIDPEEDHHISRLVFRVGGERGDGPLMDKLRAVLSRMGIELEFDSRSEGSRVLSDQGDEPDHEAASQPSPAFSDLDRDSATTEDEASEHFQLPQHDRFKPLPPLFEAEQDRGSHHASPTRLTRAPLEPNHLASEPFQQLRPPSRSCSPSTAGGTEQSRQSPPSGIGFNEQRGASDTTVQPADAIAPHSEKNENDASSLPVRSKPVRTVAWLLPPDPATEPVQNGGDLAINEHDAQTTTTPPSRLPAEKLLQGNDIKSPDRGLSTDEQQQSPPPAEKPNNDDVKVHEQDSAIDEQLGEDFESEARYELLERRAVKASRYLQLLRGTSHWRAYAIEKLERTAVARRHILRMRHFDPWELVTADTKLKGRRIFTSRLLTLWLRRAGEDIVKERRASAIAQQKLGESALAAWSRSCLTYREAPNPHCFLTVYLQQWQLTCSASQALEARVGAFCKRFVISRHCNAWWQQALCHYRDVTLYHRASVIRDSLSQWHLDTRVEVFRGRMGVKLMRDALSRWHVACRAPPSRGLPGIHGSKRPVDTKDGQVPSRPPRGTKSPLAISHKMLKTKVLGNWQRQASILAKTSTRSRRFAAHQGAQKVLDSWHIDVHNNANLSTWAQRGVFYVSVTVALRTWRSKAAWRSTTRKSYARCRQHVKATFTKGYLNRWKAAARIHGNIAWEASEHHSALERDRLVLVLTAWRDESNNDWGVSRLLTAAWVEEWRGVSQEHAGVQSRARDAWEGTLKSRYWGQWQSALLQLKSREYVASDVRERNKKKLVRRLLLHWKGDGDSGGSQPSTTMRASLGNSRRGPGLSTSRNSFQLSRAIHERPGALSFRGSRAQEFGPTAEEEDQDGPGSGADADGVVVNTPTRWTGMASSVTRLPSMTPFAPLPTPFERELRERYNRSMPSAPSSQLSRLPFAQAQRLSVADATARRTTNDGRPGALGREG